MPIELIGENRLEAAGHFIRNGRETAMRCLEAMEKKQASDLHLKSGAPPIARKNGALMLLFNERPPLNSKDLKASIEEILKPCHKQILAEEKRRA